MGGRAGTGYDGGQAGAVGTVASGTDGLDGTGGDAATASASGGFPRSRSYGNTFPPVPLLAASSRSLPRTTERVPASEELNLTALREEPSSDEGSSADEGAPSKGTGWVGSGRCGLHRPRRVRSPSTSVTSRRYPATPIWKAVTRKFEYG